jgi:hypothetical protein
MCGNPCGKRREIGRNPQKLAAFTSLHTSLGDKAKLLSHITFAQIYLIRTPQQLTLDKRPSPL